MVRQAAAMKEPAEEYMREILQWMGERLLLFSAGKSSAVDRLIDAFTYARQRFDCEVYVVDNLAKCGMAEDDYNGQKALVDRLTDFANAHGVLVLLVAHTRKGASEHEVPGKMDVKGTGAITDMVDTVCMLWRNKPKEEANQANIDDSERGDNEKTDSPDACLRVVKQRHGEWEGPIWLWFDAGSLQYLPAHKGKAFRYVGYEH
jgi:twinkle protein